MKPQMTMMKKTSTKGVNINIRSHYNDGHFWKVARRNSPPSYFFGTIHIPAKFVWDIVHTIEQPTQQAEQQTNLTLHAT